MPSVSHCVNALGRVGAIFRAARLEGTGVGPYDQSYLFYICHHPGASQEALSRALYVGKSHVTRHVTHLEKEGFITRTPLAEDRRVMQVWPTDRALAILPRLREIAGEWRGAMMSDFTAEEIACFEALLTRALANGRAAVDAEVKE